MKNQFVLQLNIVPAPTTNLLQCFGLCFNFQSGSLSTDYRFFILKSNLKSDGQKTSALFCFKGEKYEKYKNANATRMGGRRKICLYIKLKMPF